MDHSRCYEKLNGRIRDADRPEHGVKVVRDETVTRPLREEGDSDNNDHTSPVSRGSNESLPANVGRD